MIDVKWFNNHPEYHANPFYINGESYAGKIVPFLAQMISEGIILVALVLLLYVCVDDATWSGIVHMPPHNCSGIEAGMKSAPRLKASIQIDEAT